ncbi:MAG: hypothetical protein II997_08165 [Clostridia bacterium]|nr:hypothetical protein [Clostridia bacterium]
MKKGLKKILAALAAGAMLLSMNMSAFALTYNASTTYTNETTATVNVTNVTAGANDQVAFLAENGSEIIYIDQKTADASGNVTNFSFAIDLKDAIAAPTIKVGSTSTAAGAATSIKLASKTASATSNNADYGQVIVDATTVYGDVVKVYVAPYSGYAPVSYSVNGDEAQPITAISNEGYITVDLTNVSGETAAIVVNFDEADAGDVIVTAQPATKLPTGRGFTVFGTASNAVEFGALVAGTEGEITNVNQSDIANLVPNTGAVKKFAALAADGAGAFSITVEDAEVNGAYVLPNSISVATYAVGTDFKTATAGTVSLVDAE